MTNRREILRAVAVSALPALAGASGLVRRAAASASRPVSLHAILIDGRHPEARSVGAQLSTRSAPVHELRNGDVTQTWLSAIDPAWRVKPVPVAGVTERPALFCLEELALPLGLRVVFHGEHIVHPGGQTHHSLLRGASAAELSARDLERAGPLWPALIGEVIASKWEGLRRTRLGRSAAALAPVIAPGAQLLTSWIIAAA
jgi:hypothetical protein